MEQVLPPGANTHHCECKFLLTFSHFKSTRVFDEAFPFICKMSNIFIAIYTIVNFSIFFLSRLLLHSINPSECRCTLDEKD